MPDLRIEYGDGRVGYDEIWVDLDRQLAEVAGVISGQPTMSAPHLTRDWTVRVTREFRMERGKGTGWLPELLGRLEEAGHLFEYVPHPDNLSVHPGPLADDARRLGIRGLASAPARTHGLGSIEFAVWGIGGPADVTWEPFHDWLDDHLIGDTLTCGATARNSHWPAATNATLS
jgi:hypothetical protein